MPPSAIAGIGVVSSKNPSHFGVSDALYQARPTFPNVFNSAAGHTTAPEIPRRTPLPKMAVGLDSFSLKDHGFLARKERNRALAGLALFGIQTSVPL
jgi:hypothetical protein